MTRAATPSLKRGRRFALRPLTAVWMFLGLSNRRLENEILNVRDAILSRAKAVKSRDYDQAYFVSSNMRAQGTDGATATWMILGPLEEPNMWLAADHVAAEFSYVPYAGDTRVGNVIGADGYSESRLCVEGQGAGD